jgi:hypothetical protein
MSQVASSGHQGRVALRAVVEGSHAGRWRRRGGRHSSQDWDLTPPASLALCWHRRQRVGKAVFIVGQSHRLLFERRSVGLLQLDLVVVEVVLDLGLQKIRKH